MLYFEAVAVRVIDLLSRAFPGIKKKYQAHVVKLNGKWTIHHKNIYMVDLHLEVDLDDRMVSGNATIHDLMDGSSREVSVLGTTLLQSTYLTLYEAPTELHEGISYVLLKQKDSALQWQLVETEQPSRFPLKALLNKAHNCFLLAPELDCLEAWPAYALGFI